MYRLTTYGTEGSSGLRSDKVLVRGSIGECGVRTFVVEEELAPGELRGDVLDGQGPVAEVPELGSCRPVGPLRAAVPPGPSRWQDVRWDRRRNRRGEGRGLRLHQEAEDRRGPGDHPATDTPAYPFTAKTDQPAGEIKRDGTTVHLPYLTTAPGYAQELLIVNRGAKDADFWLDDLTSNGTDPASLVPPAAPATLAKEFTRTVEGGALLQRLHGSAPGRQGTCHTGRGRCWRLRCAGLRRARFRAIRHRSANWRGSLPLR